jgi:hypothetical protein
MYHARDFEQRQLASSAYEAASAPACAYVADLARQFVPVISVRPLTGPKSIESTELYPAPIESPGQNISV